MLVVLMKIDEKWRTCALVLQAVHSNRSTTFLVVLALLWKTGLV